MKEKSMKIKADNAEVRKEDQGDMWSDINNFWPIYKQNATRCQALAKKFYCIAPLTRHMNDFSIYFEGNNHMNAHKSFTRRRLIVD